MLPCTHFFLHTATMHANVQCTCRFLLQDGNGVNYVDDPTCFCGNTEDKRRVIHFKLWVIQLKVKMLQFLHLSPTHHQQQQ